MYVFLSAPSIIRYSDLGLSSHILENLALNRAVSVSLSIEVLSTITHSVACVASYGDLNSLWAVFSCAVSGVCYNSGACKCKTSSMSADRLLETV